MCILENNHNKEYPPRSLVSAASSHTRVKTLDCVTAVNPDFQPASLMGSSKFEGQLKLIDLNDNLKWGFVFFVQKQF